MYAHFESNYTLITKLGSGAYCNVYTVKHKLTGKTFAAKKFKCSDDIDSISLREITVMKKLNCRNIVKLHDIVLENRISYFIIWIILDIGKSTLSSILDRNMSTNKKCSQDDFKIFTISILNGLKHLLEHGYIHGDVKPSNLVITDNKSLQIIDLGFATKYYRQMNIELPPTSWYRPLERFYNLNVVEKVD